MNPKIILIETIAMLVLFTVTALAGTRNLAEEVYDMPQPIIDRCIELGLVDESKKRYSRQTILKKLFAALVIAAVLAVLLHFVNHVSTFREGFLISYLIWTIVDWYDCFVMDWGYVCHSKKIIIPGTEDLVDSYKDYKFHFIGSCKGMLIGLPVCLLIGAFTALTGAL